MILAKLGETTNGNVAISNGFDLEHATTHRHLVELVIDRFQQRKYLCRLSHAAPSRKTNQVSKHDGDLRKQVGYRLRLEDHITRRSHLVVVIKVLLNLRLRSKCEGTLSTLLLLGALDDPVVHFLGKERGYHLLSPSRRELELLLALIQSVIVQTE